MKRFIFHGLLRELRVFFTIPEIQLIIGCYALIFGFYGDDIKDLHYNLKDLVDYVQTSISLIGPFIQDCTELTNFIKEKVEEISELKIGETLDYSIMDYYYHILAFKPFSNYLKNENNLHNLAIFSRSIICISRIL